MRNTRLRLGALGFALLALRGPEPAAQAEQELISRARAIHDRVITLDTHNDIEPSHFTPACNYTMRLTTQVNLPKMKEGGVDGSFMVVYVGQATPPQTPDAFEPSGYERAYRTAIAKFDAIHALTETIAPDEIELALTSSDVVRIVQSGKKVAVIGVENGYPIGTDIGRVKEFWDRGGRYLSLAHNGHSQLADSNTGEATNQWMWGGLSPLGKRVIEEMNRWGIMVDVSHPSKGAVMQAMALSTAPVIASHSAVRKLANHSRNMDDEMLTALKINGGVIQIVGYSTYIVANPLERGPAIAALQREFGVRSTTGGAARGTAAPAAAPCPVEEPGRPMVALQANASNLGDLSADRRADYDRRMKEIDGQWPAVPRATVTDFVDHIDYAVKLIGVDHVGISSDFDGGGGIAGWNSVSDAFNVTRELVRRGYTEEQVAKLWGGNLLRVWAEVERVARQIQGRV